MTWVARSTPGAKYSHRELEDAGFIWSRELRRMIHVDGNDEAILSDPAAYEEAKREHARRMSRLGEMDNIKRPHWP